MRGRAVEGLSQVNQEKRRGVGERSVVRRVRPVSVSMFLILFLFWVAW